MKARSRLLGLARACVLSAAAIYGFASVSAPSGLTPRDADSIRDAVQAQIDAFATNDAPRAFSLASNDVQQAFGSAQQFMAMVRAQYPMVSRPAVVAYTRPELVGDRVMQRVHITDDDGRAWLVTYLLRRAPDRQWRISACVVAPSAKRIVA